MRRDVLLAGTALSQLTAAQTTTRDPYPEPTVEDHAIKLAPGCFPDDEPSAPCVQIRIIEPICMQRGISYRDHQRCMCEGSYFRDWNGCQACLRVQGVYGEGSVRRWESIMDSASSSLCDSDAEPTMFLNEMFAWEAISAGSYTEESAAYDATTFVGGTTVAVSEYYTVPTDQGPGITPTVTPETEAETSSEARTSTSGDETETETETEAETETETESGSGNDDDDNEDDDGAAGRVYAHGAAAIAMLMAGGAVFVAL